MIIINLTKQDIICIIDKTKIVLADNQSIETKDVETIKILHNHRSYWLSSANTSKILKLLSVFDDPFKLRKEHHVVIDCEISKKSFLDYGQIVITSDVISADTTSGIYYDYFTLKADDKPIAPSRIYISEKDKIKEAFKQNHSKLIHWDAFWNVFIEPILTEAIGYLMIYFIFSVWIGKFAWLVIFLMVAVSIIIESILLIFKIRNERKKNYSHFFDECKIQNDCYGKM